AQARMVELLAEAGQVLGHRRPIEHEVKYYEKGERPLEIVTSRQWFVRTVEHRAALLARGDELAWHPAYMAARYRSWVEGLTGDWIVSRQRFFGVPIPVWYPLDGGGEVSYDAPLLPAEDRLPVDPSSDAPDGYGEHQRGQPGGFVADPDVMDTWATSSLTPQIATGWEDDPDLFARTFPMDLRPQGHEIIRTWLFYTVARAHFEHGSLPFTNAAISGWVLDPDRKKMSKSDGNVVTPAPLLEQYGSDAVRYWAASARPGTDLAVDYQQMKVGRRLAIKILNASRFVLSRMGEVGAVTAPLDQSMLAGLSALIADATRAFEGYDYARALERTEAFFWSFCDDYLELVKARAYGGHGAEAAASANQSLSVALSALLRLFAPFLPFVSEEVWSWWQQGSVHRSSWPDVAEAASLLGADADPTVLAVAADVLGEVRRAKSAAKVSLRAPVASVVVRDRPERLAALRRAGADLRDAGTIAGIAYEGAGAFEVVVTLG
ncbi:MAG: class I tRNA ligase family protein, partial [Acidimicrobiales bacterium]